MLSHGHVLGLRGFFLTCTPATCERTMHGPDPVNLVACRCLGFCRIVCCQHENDVGLDACMITWSTRSFRIRKPSHPGQEPTMLTISQTSDDGNIQAASHNRPGRDILCSAGQHSPGTVQSLQGLHMVSLDPTCVSTAVVDLKSAMIDWVAMLPDTTLQRHVTVLPCCSLSVT